QANRSAEARSRDRRRNSPLRGGEGSAKAAARRENLGRSGARAHLTAGFDLRRVPIMRTTFTVEDANRTLPLVRRIVGDAVRDYWRWQEKVREYEEVAANRKVDQPNEDAKRLEREASSLRGTSTATSPKFVSWESR